MKNATLWVLQVLGGAMFLMAGSSKLAGNEAMVQMFNAIGVGQWFRYVTGGIEVGAGLLLFVPALAGVAALLLSATMIGAVLTHLFVIGGSPAIPLVLLAFMITVAYGRRDRSLALIGRENKSWKTRVA